MRNPLFLLVLLVCSKTVGNAQTNSSVATTNLSIAAESIERQGSVLLCRGRVEITTDTMVLHADEMDYHSDTGEAEVRGNVRMKLRSPIKAMCQGAGCVSADSPKAPAMAKISEALEKMLADRQGQTPK